MMYQPNPFDEEDDEQTLSPQEFMQAISPYKTSTIGGDSEIIKLSGVRSSKLTLDFHKSNERSIDRDAIMLEAVLSTTLESDTFLKLCTLLYNKYIAPMQIQAAQEAATVPPTTRKKKVRVAPTN